MIPLRPTLAGALLLAGSVFAQPTTELPSLVVTANRIPQAAAAVPVRIDRFTATDLTSSPALTIDDQLAASAGFSLFRRSGSLTANPTAQGLSLRGLGPSGAGRALVLLDGVPLNDPFGGWVPWSRLSSLTLAGAEIVRGGGSGAWGNAALGGVLQLFTAPPVNSQRIVRLEAGDFATTHAELVLDQATGPGWLRVAANHFNTDGTWLRPSAQRGAVDRPADLRHETFTLGWQTAPAASTTLSLQAGYTAEDRGNGTAQQRNATTAAWVSVNATGRLDQLPGTPTWSTTAYAQQQSYESLFTAVDDDRAAETPVLDQYDVPAFAGGASASLTWAAQATTASTLGLDVRSVRGETREAYFRVSDTFTRGRVAGGTQDFLGVFVSHHQTLAPDWQTTGTLRVDAWRNRAGHRREQDRASGALLRDETFAADDGFEFSPSLGLSWQARPDLKLRAAAYRAFRLPTLNEYYRPFRVGNVITEANPALAVEHVTGGELGAEWTTSRAGASVTGFLNELTDPVANVTLGFGPGTVPGVGFVPAGGTGRQRRNLASLRTRGIEFDAYWRINDTLNLRTDAVYNDSVVTGSTPGAAEDLVGRRPPQVPDYTVTAGIVWEPSAAWRLDLNARYLSEAFEDDLNQLTLAPATTLNLRVARRFGLGRELYVAVENLTDTTVETSRAADGSITVGSPRTARIGVRWLW